MKLPRVPETFHARFAVSVVFIVTGAKNFAARDFGLWPTPKHPAARKKQTLVSRITGSLRCAFLPLPPPLFPIALRFTGIQSYIKLRRKERSRKKYATYYLGVEHVTPGGLLYERGRDARRKYWIKPLNEIDSAGSYRVPPPPLPSDLFCHAYVLFGNIIALQVIYSDVQGSAGYSRTPPTPSLVLSCILPVWQLQVTYADVLVTDQSSRDSKRSQR